MHITRGLEYIKSYFDKKSDQNRGKAFPDNFTTYRKIQTEHIKNALEHLIREIKRIQDIFAGNTNEWTLTDAQAIKDTIDLYKGKTTRKDSHLIGGVSSSDFSDIKDIISSFPYKKIKEKQKEYDKNTERLIELEKYTNINWLDAKYTPEGKIAFSGFYEEKPR
ncbi:MAG: hypothetical protein WCH65_02125 [bacterium]